MVTKNRSRYLRVLFPLMVVVGSLSGCTSESVVAKVDGEEITADELIAEAKQRGVAPEARALQQLLDTIIDRNVAALKAEDMDLDEDPEFRRAYRNLALETLKRRYRLDWEQELTVTDADVQAAYDREPDRYTVPEKIRIALIEFDGSKPEGKALAESALNQVQTATNGDERDNLFQSLAVMHSLDRASRYRGGAVGVLARGETSSWPASVQTAAFALQEAGDLSPLIEAGGKLYLVKLERRQPSRLEPFKAVQENIRQRLLTARFDDIHKRLQQRLREDVAIKIYPRHLAALISEDTAGEKEPRAPQGPALN